VVQQPALGGAGLLGDGLERELRGVADEEAGGGVEQAVAGLAGRATRH
jgi:hypothetical protein